MGCHLIIFHFDNMSVVHVINSKQSPANKYCNLTLVTNEYTNFHFKAQHVPGFSKELADSLIVSGEQFSSAGLLSPLPTKKTLISICCLEHCLAKVRTIFVAPATPKSYQTGSYAFIDS